MKRPDFKRSYIETLLIKFLNLLVFIGYVILYLLEQLSKLFIKVVDLIKIIYRKINIVDIKAMLIITSHDVLHGFRIFWRDVKTLFKGYILNDLKHFKSNVLKIRNFGFMIKNLSFFATKRPRLHYWTRVKTHAVPKIVRYSYVLHFIYGIVFAVVFMLMPYKVYTWYRELPQPTLLKMISDYNRSTRILDRKGRLLYEIYVDKKYEPVSLDRIPAYAIEATLAIEDHTFYSHVGFSFLSMLRALKANITGGDLQGASTITQQLIKNVLLTPERTVSRKLKELVLSVMVEKKYTKNQILEMYLNNIPYGGTAWGIQSASKKFFGKDVSDLDLAESAFLAGLPSSPSIYSPFAGDDLLSKSRQKTVLQRMVDLGYISQEKADEAYQEELYIVPQEEYIKAPHFVAFVREELNRKYGRRLVDFGGLTVTTTLDLDLQEKAENIVSQEISSDAYLNISNGASIALDSRTGGILAYVGSVDYFKDKWGAFDIVTASRQPGSTVKVVTYSLALSKNYTASSILNDSAITYQLWAGQKYTPVNYDGVFHGNVTLRQALANSYNIPAVKVVKDIGPDNMVDLGNKMGLKDWKVDGSYGLSVTLGGKETSLLNLTNVFATLSRGGFFKEVSPFESVLDVNGFEIYSSGNVEGERVLSKEVSYIITSILSDYYARIPSFGTNNFLSIPGRTVAVKTGTTDSKRDNYTVGYTPSFVVGVWVGNNDNSPMNPNLASGLSGAAPIWNKIMSTLLDNKDVEKFEVPTNIVVKTDKECGNVTEIFVKGTVPVRLCVEKKDEEKKDRNKNKN